MKRILSSLWLYLPARLRRFTVRMTNARFTVTAAGIIHDEAGRVLLLKHRFRAGSGWGIPGGFLEAEEQAVDALRRELSEEVGLKLHELRLFAVRTFKSQNQIEVVFIACTSDQPQIKSVEVEQAGWFSVTSLPAGLPPDQKKLIERALSDGARGCD